MGIIKCFNTECRDFSRSEVDNCSRPLTRIQECPEAIVRKSNSRDQKSEVGSQREKNFAWYVNELRSNECACGAEKKRGRVFCYKCFMALPYDLRQGLYKKMGEGYEEAREDAGLWLESRLKAVRKNYECCCIL